MNVLMLSRDQKGVDETSATFSRWKEYVENGVRLTCLISARKEGEIHSSGIDVWSSGGASPVLRLWRTWKKAKIAAQGVDLITAQDPFELGLVAYLIGRRLRIPVEIQDHGGFFDGEVSNEPLWFIRSRLANWLAKRVRSIRTVSPKSFAMLQKKAIPAKLLLYPIAADTRFFAATYQPEPHHFVTVARLIPLKNVDLVLRVFALYRQKQSSAKLTIVGDGPERAALETLAAELGIKAAVVFTGEADPLPYLERASVFMLLSRHEGWGVAALEAAAVGVPVIMTDTGCASWLENKGKASIVRTTQLDEIVDALVAIQASVKQPVKNLESIGSIPSYIAHWKECTKKRLLICIQAVDGKDPLMGFFLRWLKEASKQFETITVCALRVGEFSLPENITVLPLRSNGSHSKFEVIKNVFVYSWNARKNYQAVFVRGDAQYVVLAGLFWRLLGKRVLFWYAHYRVSLMATVASIIAHQTLTSVKEAFDGRGKNVLRIGQGIDSTQFQFIEKNQTPKEKTTFVIFGRVMPSKRIENCIRAFIDSGAESWATLTISGPQPDPGYKSQLQSLMDGHPAIQWGELSVPYEQVPQYLAGFDGMLNAYSASLDKSILESMMVGLISLVSTRGILHNLPKDLNWIVVETPEEWIGAMQKVQALSTKERQELRRALHDFVSNNHSLQTQVAKISELS